MHKRYGSNFRHYAYWKYIDEMTTRLAKAIVILGESDEKNG